MLTRVPSVRAYRVSSRAMLVLRRVTHTPSIARLFFSALRILLPTLSLEIAATRIAEIRITRNGIGDGNLATFTKDRGGGSVTDK